MTPGTDTYLTPFCWRILEAILRLDDGKPITVRRVNELLGRKGLGSIVVCMDRLVERGLIAKDSKRCGTIRPRVRFIPARDLCEL